MAEIQDKIKKLIEVYGSHKKAAAALCVTPRALSFWASGDRAVHPGFERLMDLAIEQPELFGEE